MGICDGRVAIVTGAGRGIGREHALMLAAEGATVVVNDLGGGPDGSGADPGPAHEVVAESEAMGGRAVVNGSDVTDFDDAAVMVRQAVDTFGRLDVLVNNAGIIRDKMVFSMGEQDWDDVVGVHLKGHFCPTRHAAAPLAGRGQGRPRRRRPHREHRVAVGPVRQRGSGQLRRRQGRDRLVHAGVRSGARTPGRDGQTASPLRLSPGCWRR